ncbi:acyltransferase [Pedobacter sp. GR22-10]|uniref:acyltransferase n=1 Tax=Pedobacter sp. GR22-10 TaxID=2994472 RepID=UPI002246D356|nr:acyltransferase [Pedobacter sp. GR22-10]MCX2432361.1 acyltransferase [Pedobacter sp. GR22-10]
MFDKILSYFKQLKYKAHLKSVMSFIEIGSSHLLENFKLRITNPIANKKYVTIGQGSILNCEIIFETEQGNVQVGNNSYIGNTTIICRSNVVFEDNIFVAWGGYFYDHDSHSLDYKERRKDIATQLHDYRAGRNFIENKNWNVVNSKPIRICSDAWIGMNCIILKGVTIGEGAIVGAGSIVTKDVEPWTIVGGNPARKLKDIPQELRKK